MNERRELQSEREELRVRRKRVVIEIDSHRESLRAALPLTAEAAELDGEYIMSLALILNERCVELAGLDRKIAILTRGLEG